MVVVIIFLLAVLFVAAVWGREAAQRMFKGGAKVAGVLFALAAIGVLLLAINLEAPDQSALQRDLEAASRSAYHVSLDTGQGGNADAGAALRRPEAYATAPNNAPAPIYNAPTYTTPAPVTRYATPDLGNPKIGVTLDPLQPQNGAAYGLPAGYGMYVRAVLPGTTAERAGLRAGDYIAQVDGVWLQRLDTLNRHNAGKQVGDVISLRVLRGGGQYLVNVPLGNP